MQVVYEGPHMEGVEIAATEQHAPHGVPIEVAEDLGVLLCQQVGTWREHKADTKPAKKGDA